MTRYPDMAFVIRSQARLVEVTGGIHGIRDEDAIRSVLELVQASYSGQEAYPTLADKAAYLGFALCQNHPFNDGNKRTAWLVMSAFLHINRRRIAAPLAESEGMMLKLAAGELRLEEFTAWVRARVRRDG